MSYTAEAQVSQNRGAQEFYKGATIAMIVGYPPGGGYDFFARFVARNIGRHIIGAPTVITQNMPGAGGLRAANYVYNQAPKDGTVLSVPAQVVALTEALGDPGVQYKSSGYIWIGRVTTNVDISLTWRTAKVKSIQDAMVNEAIVAGIGPLGSSGSTLYPTVLNNVIGTKFKIVSGYEGASAALLAMERGETDGAYTSWNTIKTSKSGWHKNNDINILVQYSMERHPDLANVPTMVELAQSDDDKKLLAIYASGAVVGRSVLTTPGVPADRIAALRQAFDGMIKDSDFLYEIEKTKAEFDEPMSGEKLQKLVAEMMDVPAAILERAKAARGLKE